MPSRAFPSRHVYISVVVWDSICALSALLGVASDVHFVPTTYDFHSPLVTLVANFQDGLECGPGVCMRTLPVCIWV